MTTPRHTLGVLGLALLTAGSVCLSAQRGPQRRNEPQFVAMSGTYELEATRGENPERAADRATRDLPRFERDRAYESLRRRLDPPATIAIDRDRNGRTFTVCSSSGPRATFDADGETRREPGPGGRITMTHVEFTGDRLSIWTSGNRETDFLVTFQPLDNGRNLLVTRRLDSDDLRRPVTIQSYYRRIADEPRWDLYGPERRYDRRPEPPAFAVPEGTRLEAVLDTPLSTRTSRNGERFSMTVRGPGAYRDMRVDGVIARITPGGPGRNADLRIDFDTIRLRDGRTVEFDAVVETVRTPGGGTLRVDASGNEPDRDRTADTIEKGAIGAALGAVIGAMAGGGKGAAIGAVLGGAGGVILAQDRDDHLDLPPGTEITMRVTSRRYRTP
jgi:YmgG-like glycine-zipper protein